MNIRSAALIAIAWPLMTGAYSLAPIDNKAHVPVKALDIGGLQIGETSLNEVELRLGPAPVQSYEDGLVNTLCYFSKKTQKFVVVQLDAGVLGGLQRLTGIRVQAIDSPPKKCSPSHVDLGSMSIGAGVILGQSKRDFKARIPLQFVRNGNRLVYKVEYKREMTEKELASMRQQWPEMPSPSFFDVVEFVQGEFRGDALESYEIRRTESY